MAKKSTKSEEPKKKKPISLNILEIAKRLQKLEETGGGGGTPYTLPTASANTKGGVKIGEGLTMDGEVLSATGGSADSAKRTDIATEFNTTTSYTAGCFVYHEGTLYQFNADHAAGAWDPTDVVAANVTNQVVSNKAYIDEVNEDLGEITDNLNGFKFYPAGTAIVGLVSDDSPYTDTNGNYILAASTTGQSMIDDVTYKSINSTIDARGKVGADSATPFKSGGTTLVDINPNKVSNDFYVLIGASNDQYLATPVCGYKKIALHSTSARTINYYFVLTDGTQTTTQSVELTQEVWTDYIDIPDGAIALFQRSTGNRASGNISILTN